MEIERANHKEGEKELAKGSLVHSRCYWLEAKDSTNPTSHQHPKSTHYNNIKTQGWLGSHVLSPQAQHRIFPIFQTLNAHIEHDNHSI